MPLNTEKALFLFDMAGTLVDWYPEKRVERLAPFTAMSPADINRKLFFDADSPGVAFDRGLILATEFYKECCKLLGVEPTQEFAGKFRHAYADIFTARPRMGELLATLRPHHDLWMMSNTNFWHLDHVRLAFPYFAHLTTLCNSDTTGFLKPEEGIFKAAMEMSGRPASEMIFIDDRAENIAAAKGLGIHAIHFQGNEDTLIAELRALGVRPLA